MPYAMFHEYFPEIAVSETRSVTLLHENEWGLPIGNYGFLEMFCNEPGCDCRRVFLAVHSEQTKNFEAYIAYGWENHAYYRKWLGDNDPQMIRELKGPALNLSSPQSALAPALLRLFEEVLLKDVSYIERIKQHYRIFRSRIDKPNKTLPLRGAKNSRRKK